MSDEYTDETTFEAGTDGWSGYAGTDEAPAPNGDCCDDVAQPAQTWAPDPAVDAGADLLSVEAAQQGLAAPSVETVNFAGGDDDLVAPTPITLESDPTYGYEGLLAPPPETTAAPDPTYGYGDLLAPPPETTAAPDPTYGYADLLAPPPETTAAPDPTYGYADLLRATTRNDRRARPHLRLRRLARATTRNDSRARPHLRLHRPRHFGLRERRGPRNASAICRRVRASCESTRRSDSAPAWFY